LNGVQLAVTNIKRHSDEYRDEMDLIKQWMDECLQASWGTLTKANDLYQSFKQWQQDNGHYTLNSGAFYRKLSRHLGKSIKKSNGSHYSDYVII